MIVNKCEKCGCTNCLVQYYPKFEPHYLCFECSIDECERIRKDRNVRKNKGT